MSTRNYLEPRSGFSAELRRQLHGQTAQNDALHPIGHMIESHEMPAGVAEHQHNLICHRVAGIVCHIHLWSLISGGSLVWSVVCWRSAQRLLVGFLSLIGPPTHPNTIHHRLTC